jgi:hypothetical protein
MALRIHGSHRRAIPLSETIEAWILIVGIIAAVALAKSHILASLIASMGAYEPLGAFAAGLFFTSMLTTLPAIVALGEFAQYLPAWQVAILGGIGAVVGDLLIFRFVRSRFVEDLVRAAFSPGWRLVGRAISAGPMWWLGPVTGAIVIASPLPDELGLLMMGLSQISWRAFVPIALVANSAGIYLIAIAVQSL